MCVSCQSDYEPDASGRNCVATANSLNLMSLNTDADEGDKIEMVIENEEATDSETIIIISGVGIVILSIVLLAVYKFTNGKQTMPNELNEETQPEM